MLSLPLLLAKRSMLLAVCSGELALFIEKRTFRILLFADINYCSNRERQDNIIGWII